MFRSRTLLTLATVAVLLGTIPRSAEASPPWPPPEIHAITPTEVPVLLGGLISVQGLHFQYLSYVDVGGAVFQPWQLATYTDTLLQFTIPLGAALGRTKVQVWTNGGLAVGWFSFVPNDPPVLIGPTLIENGETHKWWTAGEPNRTGFLLVNTTGQTVPLVGHQVLAYDLLLPHPQLSPIGVEEIVVPVNGLPVGLQVWMQFVSLEPPGDVGTLKVSNLLPITVTA